MEPRKSARLREKGRRHWVDDESEDANLAAEDLASKDGPRTKRARIDGLDEEAEEESRDADYVESESGGEDDTVELHASKRTKGRARSTERRESAGAQKDWDQLFEEDDANHEAETVQDFPSEVEVIGPDDYFVIDGYVYRKLPADRKCGLHGIYLRCYQDKDLKCGARATAIRTTEGKLMAKISKTGDQHSHERPPQGSHLLPMPPKTDSAQPQRKRRSQRQEPSRRRGRPPKVVPSDDDDNESDFGEEDNGKRYQLPIEIFGMKKYFVMDGYVYRRSRERRIGHGGLYLRCYQDKELHCPARAVAVWFKKRDEVEPIGERGERFLFGRLSTTHPNHSHPRPPKGHFWVKPGQQIVLLPPHLRRSGAADDVSNTEYIDFTEPVSDPSVGEERDRGSVAGSKRYPLSVASRSFDDHRYTPAEVLRGPKETFSRRQDAASQKKRLRSKDVIDTPSDNARRLGRSGLVEDAEEASRPKTAITMRVQVDDSGEYFVIDGYAFKRQARGQPQLICVEAKRESKCGARATLLESDSSMKSTRSGGARAQFESAKARRHTHFRPTRGQHVLPPKLTAAIPATKPSPASSKFTPASSALMIFTRTPFLRPLSVPPRAADESKGIGNFESRTVNLKSIMNNYRYCMDALIRLQDGYYVGRFPQLSRLIDATGSELIEYYTQPSHSRLPMVAGDERTAYLLNNEMKHYRAICDFMQMAQNDCERVIEAYRRWITPARSRAWWNSGDILEYICRILLRTDEYSEAYGSALSLCQRSTRLHHLFRPLLPFPEPKFLRCEKETIRRWEMRQALEDVNSRISSVRLREGDSDVAINRLLDEFETAVSSFLKFYSRQEAAEPKGRDDDDGSSVASSEDSRAEAGSAEKDGKRSRGLDRPPVLTAAAASDQKESSSDDDNMGAVKRSNIRRKTGKPK